MRPLRAKRTLRYYDNDDDLFFRSPFAKNQGDLVAVVRGLPFFLVNHGKLSLISRVSDISLGTFYIYFKFSW